MTTKTPEAFRDGLSIKKNGKDGLRVGQAQVWNEYSVIRHPAHLVATYSILLLAALKRYGDGRSDVYFKLTKWRKKPPELHLTKYLTH